MKTLTRESKFLYIHVFGHVYVHMLKFFLSSSQVSKVHRHQCSSLAVSEDSRFLLTAGHNTVKVWDYNMKLDINSQVAYRRFNIFYY